MATVKGRQAACSWSALDNAAALPSQPRLRAAMGTGSWQRNSLAMATLHLASQQPGHDGQSYRRSRTMQPSCRQLDCSWQRINLARLIIATGSQAPCSEATGRGLATQQPWQGGQGSWQPGTWMQLCNVAASQCWSGPQVARQQPARQLHGVFEPSSLAMAVKAPGSHGHRLLATQQPCNGYR